MINFIKISKLDRRRQRVIGKLEAVQRELKEVREEWQKTHTQIQDEQETLQAQWQESTLTLAQLQTELNYLDEEVSREALARRRAVRFVIDDLKEPVACPDGDLKQELDSIVTVNVQTDDYQEGLGSVSGLMSVLEGIMKGMERFDESVNGLITEQKMHSSYLSKLNVSLPEEVLAYHKQWDGLRQKVRDDGIHCANPVKFVTAVRPVVEGDLSEASIKAMFDGLGQALNRATHKWKG